MTEPVTSTVGMRSLENAIKRLRALTYRNGIEHWRYCIQDLPTLVATAPQTWKDWSVVQLDARDYVVWSAGSQVIWLGQQLIIPHDLQGYPLAGLSLRLALRWWAQLAQIFVNGQLVQEGDLFDCSTRVFLSSQVKPGETIEVALRLLSPQHDQGALVRSEWVYEVASDDRIDPGFVADELAIVYQYLQTLEPEKLDTLVTNVTEINWDTVSSGEEFERSLHTLRQNLHSLLPHPTPQISLLGHSHIDMAWLWPINETWQVAQRTFESVLVLQQEFSNLTFCHSTPALYAWIEQHRRDLFAAIKQQIVAGRWEVVGGLWVEPELNLISGESIVRQILYAQRYVWEKFGQLTQVAWLPDSFGFTWQLPQLLKQGGIDYFVTQKLRWNDTSEFPHEAFWWRALDGTQVFALMSALIGQDIDPLKMATYAVKWQAQTGIENSLWLPGVGDHGGGPTRDMLEVAQRWQQSPCFGHLEFTTAHRYLAATVGANPSSVPLDNEQDFPVWDDELYLEFHRGCYTSHADQKRWNRRCEGLLYQAELFASIASLLTGASYPKQQLEEAWKQVLFNQFHDILPGTAIAEVFTEVNSRWQEVEQVGSTVLDESLRVIASQITLPSPPHPRARPVIIFNPLNWTRQELVSVSLPEFEETAWQVYDSSGHPILSQQVEPSRLLFLVKNIPAVGYRVFWLSPMDTSANLSEQQPLSTEDFTLENELLRVEVNPTTGDLYSVFDKIHQREVLRGVGNQLQGFQDRGQYWDAWNIDPDYEQYRLPPTELQSIQWLERGKLRSRLRVVRQLGQSQFIQDYILDSGSPVLKIATTVEWRETHVLVKAAFPLNVEVNYATYEIACGAIQRSTRPQTPAQRAKWEVPAMGWADLSESSYGVSLLNDCKYGYDAQPSQLRLTLLRSPTWPDPNADRGTHHFTYALYPHKGNWQNAATVRRGYELNLPLVVLSGSSVETDKKASLSPVGRLLDLNAVNLVLMAFKPSETTPNQWILRCYECHGESADLGLEGDLGLSLAYPVDLLERPVAAPEASPDRQSFRILPWKIKSFVVKTDTIPSPPDR